MSMLIVMDIFDMNEYHVEVAGTLLTEVVPDVVVVDPDTGNVSC